MQLSEPGGVEFHDFHPDLGDFREEVLAGLNASPKRIAPKFFYDQRGSGLFEKICELPEYYPTRTETAILRQHADEIADLISGGSGDGLIKSSIRETNCEPSGDSDPALAGTPILIEYGSGAGRKTRILLDALGGQGVYVPIDISKQHLLESAAEPASAYPRLRVVAVCADYSKPFSLPSDLAVLGRRRVAFFPGSTIGNFDPPEAEAFLKRVVKLVGPGGALLLGVDLKKDPAVLDAAYNDAAGITAQFNLNLLDRMNREMGADFDLAGFRHRAFYNEPLGRVEMHLESLRDQTVRVADRSIGFGQGETIHTENSYKYSVDETHRLAAKAGLNAGRIWTDADQLFSVHYLTVED